MYWTLPEEDFDLDELMDCQNCNYGIECTNGLLKKCIHEIIPCKNCRHGFSCIYKEGTDCLPELLNK